MEQQAGGIFSASEGGSGEARGGGTRMASGVVGAEETVPRDQISILGYETLENTRERQVLQGD